MTTAYQKLDAACDECLQHMQDIAGIANHVMESLEAQASIYAPAWNEVIQHHVTNPFQSIALAIDHAFEDGGMGKNPDFAEDIRDALRFAAIRQSNGFNPADYTDWKAVDAELHNHHGLARSANAIAAFQHFHPDMPDICRETLEEVASCLQAMNNALGIVSKNLTQVETLHNRQLSQRHAPRHTA